MPTIPDILLLPIVVVVLGGKGGIGKSLISQLIAAMLRMLRGRVLMIDTDHTNSSSASIDPDAVMIDVRDTTARGSVRVALQRLKAGECRSIVMDTGAQEDSFIADLLPWLKAECDSVGALLVPVLPVTLSSHNQARAVHFAEASVTLGLPTIFVRNLGQGRKVTDYTHWARTKTRAAALARGVVEMPLPDLGARWTDEAAGFGLSLADVAQGDFSKAGHEADAARLTFPLDVQAWFGIYASEFGDAFIASLVESITKQADLGRNRKGN